MPFIKSFSRSFSKLNTNLTATSVLVIKACFFAVITAMSLRLLRAADLNIFIYITTVSPQCINKQLGVPPRKEFNYRQTQNPSFTSIESKFRPITAAALHTELSLRTINKYIQELNHHSSFSVIYNNCMFQKKILKVGFIFLRVDITSVNAH